MNVTSMLCSRTKLRRLHAAVKCACDARRKCIRQRTQEAFRAPHRTRADHIPLSESNTQPPSKAQCLGLLVLPTIHLTRPRRPFPSRALLANIAASSSCALETRKEIVGMGSNHCYGLQLYLQSVGVPERAPGLLALLSSPSSGSDHGPHSRFHSSPSLGS